MPNKKKSHSFLSFLRSRFVLLLCAGTFAIMTAITLFVMQPSWLRHIDYKVYDLISERFAHGAKTRVPIIIDIDEKTLDKYGQWPWSRVLTAELLTVLQEYGIAAVGMDMLLSEEDRTSPLSLQAYLKEYADVDLKLDTVPESLHNYDHTLRDTLTPRMILGINLQYEESAESVHASKGTPFMVRKTKDALPWDASVPKAHSGIFPTPVLQEKAQVGLLDINPDDDGVVRRVPIVGIYDDELYLSLSVRALLAALNKKSVTLVTDQDGLTALRVGQYQIKLSPDGTSMPLFRGKRESFPYYSIADILEHKIPKEDLEGRIAFIGTSSPGLLDIRTSPLERTLPGVEIHATVLDNVISDDFMSSPPWLPGAQVLGILCVGIIITLAFAFASVQVYLPLAILLVGATIYTSIDFFSDGYFISPSYVLICIVQASMTILFARFWLEERQKKVLRSAFSRYVAPEVVDKITKLDGDVLSGEERELSILFTDIRGFTSLSEQHSPDKIVLLLNRYFTPMTHLVRIHKGTLDKFIGDALMAFWNAPLDVKDHALQALTTAAAMLDKVEEINPTLQEEFGATLRIGAGVHTGKAYVGNMGSEELLDYTAIGDNVNLCARLEGLCGHFGVNFVTSKETLTQALSSLYTQEKKKYENPLEVYFGNPWEETFDLFFQPLDKLKVKGKAEPVDVYFIINMREAQTRKEELTRHKEAYFAYLDGDFDKAEQEFDALQKSYADVKVYSIFMERIKQIKEQKIDNWDGVWTLTDK